MNNPDSLLSYAMDSSSLIDPVALTEKVHADPKHGYAVSVVRLMNLNNTVPEIAASGCVNIN